MMPTVVPGGLPDEYQAVEYLFRSETYGGPVSLIYASVSQGDIVETGTKNIPLHSSGDKAILGDASSLEIYYAAGNADNLLAWRSDIIEIISVEYGDADKLQARILANATIKFLGIYRYNNYKLNGRIYYLKIKDSNGNLKYNYVPCYRKSDNEAGFYETVNGVFYPNDNVPGQSGRTGTWEIPT